MKIVSDEEAEKSILAEVTQIDGPVAYTVIIETLEELLAETKAGEVTALAVIVGRRAGAWSNQMAGNINYDNLAGLNLRVDLMKAFIMRHIEPVSSES